MSMQFQLLNMHFHQSQILKLKLWNTVLLKRNCLSASCIASTSRISKALLSNPSSTWKPLHDCQLVSRQTPALCKKMLIFCNKLGTALIHIYTSYIITNYPSSVMASINPFFTSN